MFVARNMELKRQTGKVSSFFIQFVYSRNGELLCPPCNRARKKDRETGRNPHQSNVKFNCQLK
jgi:hypothetical protein